MNSFLNNENSVRLIGDVETLSACKFYKFGIWEGDISKKLLVLMLSF